MIMDFMETDLHKIIYSKNELTDEHIQVSNNGSGVIAWARLVVQGSASLTVWHPPPSTHLHPFLAVNPFASQFCVHQYFIYQLLKGLKYIHSAHVIHRSAGGQQQQLRE